MGRGVKVSSVRTEEEGRVDPVPIGGHEWSWRHCRTRGAGNSAHGAASLGQDRRHVRPGIPREG